MTDANRAMKQDPFLDGDDPFLDAADVERLLLGEATREDMNRAPAPQETEDDLDRDEPIPCKTAGAVSTGDA
mgnify:CR=1 FL=1